MIDITTPKARTWRLSLLGGMIGISIPIANLLSGYIYDSGGNMAIWGTSLALNACALLYIFFGFTDSRGKKSIEKLKHATLDKILQEKQVINHTQDTSNIFRDVFKNLVRSFSLTFQRREGYKRACISLLITVTCILFFANGNA